MIQFKFDLLKSAQATAHLLRHAGPTKTDNYTRIIKLLYKADRESLRERGKPVTGDDIVAMKHGHVLSRVYALIMERDFELDGWMKYIERSGEFDITLHQDPGNSELSPYEVNLLERICHENRDKDQWELIEELHSLPEFEKNDPRKIGVKTLPIFFEDIIEGLEESPATKLEILARARESAETEALFQTSGS